MKKEIWLILIVISVLIIISQGVLAASYLSCYTSKPVVRFDLNITPHDNCFNIISTSVCEFEYISILIIDNKNCTEKLFYVYENEQEVEVKPNSEMPDMKISQQVGVEWVKYLYFEGDKENKTIIYGKNLPYSSSTSVPANTNGNRSYLYYLAGGVILFLIGIYFIFRRRKSRFS